MLGIIGDEFLLYGLDVILELDVKLLRYEVVVCFVMFWIVFSDISGMLEDKKKIIVM